MSLPTLSTKLRRIAAQVSDGQRVFTTLAHWIDVDLLRAAFDGETKADYAEDLESNRRLYPEGWMRSSLRDCTAPGIQARGAVPR